MWGCNNFINQSNRRNKKKIEKIEKIENTRKNYYHKPDKSHKMALIFSIFLPFFGNLYLRENIINLFATIVSILIIIANIIGLLTISDFYYRYDYYTVYIYVLWWILSMILLIIFIIGYNKHEVYYKKDDDKYSRESQLQNLFNKQYIKYIPFIICILFLIVNIGVMFSDSPKTFDTSDFTFQYPHEYKSDGKWEYNSGWIQAKNYGNSIEIKRFYASESISDYADELLHVRYADGSGHIDNIDKGKINVDGTEAYVIQGKDTKWTNVMFVRDGQLYQLIFEGDSQKDMDTIINSFKFK